MLRNPSFQFNIGTKLWLEFRYQSKKNNRYRRISDGYQIFFYTSLLWSPIYDIFDIHSSLAETNEDGYRGLSVLIVLLGCFCPIFFGKESNITITGKWISFHKTFGEPKKTSFFTNKNWFWVLLALLDPNHSLLLSVKSVIENQHEEGYKSNCQIRDNSLLGSQTCLNKIWRH